LIGTNEIEIRNLFVEMENIARKFRLHINQEKTKYMIVERKNSLKINKIEHLKIKNYQFERVESFKYLGVTHNEDNNNQNRLARRNKKCQQNLFYTSTIFFKNKNTSKKLKLRLKNTTDKTLTDASETGTLTKRSGKQLNIFERKVYRRISGSVKKMKKKIGGY
jgi:hypothetical protein